MKYQEEAQCWGETRCLNINITCSECLPSAIKHCFKNVGPTICVAVTSHHAPIFWLWRGTSKVSLGIILLQYLLILVLMHPLRWNQASSVKNVCFGSRTPPYTACLLQPVLFYTTSASAAFCLMHSLSKKDPTECTFFTNLHINDESGTQILGYIWRNLLLHNLWDLFFTWLVIQLSPLFKCKF
jgi:hypothetical protein